MRRSIDRRLWMWAAACAAAVLAMTGCEETENTPTAKPANSAPAGAPDAAAPQQAPPFASAGGAAGGAPTSGAAPFAGAANMSPAQALAHVPSLDPSLAPLKKSYDAAAAKLKQKPSDPAAAKAYVAAAYQYGHAIEYSNTINDPPIKYRASMLLYRDALKVDPHNQPSQTELDQIESIYKSMGMPVPK